ncbi:low molecular weight phosphatase family protein [Mycolicibacterium vanbaalenii]|nr:low molecular weight phosphatase family protein [Mycolicibacterium vanbaalenii]WND59664.1 low molecular weight phosphatase family protein [Mycolicibacterium vanbaalenii]
MFVCTGNICRSPMAERLTVLAASRLQLPGLLVSSAGTRAVVGRPMHPEAAFFIDSVGADSKRFVARQLTPRIAESADLILTMTREHRDDVLSRSPRLLRKTFTLAEASRLASQKNLHLADLAAGRPLLAGEELPDVPDPIGQPAAIFTAVGRQIAQLLPPILVAVQGMEPRT